MERCHNCQAEILFEGSEFCEHCGTKLIPSSSSKPRENTEDDGYDFVVTESLEDRSASAVTRRPVDQSDAIPLESSADFLHRHVAGSSQEESGVPGQTPTSAPTSTSTATSAVASAAPSKSGDPKDGHEHIPKLSEAEVKSIEKGMYKTASYLSEEEKQDLLRSMDHSGNASASTVNLLKSKASAGSVPQDANGVQSMARRGRGMAFFSRNTIVLQGDIDLHEQDEIQIRDRTFLLKKKHSNPKVTLIAGGAAFAVILFVIASFLISDAGGGKGEIIGVALDADHRPFLQGATIQFPDLGVTVKTNGEGFFRAEKIPAGSHKIEYIVNGQRVAVDYATVVAGQSSTVTLGFSDGQLAQSEPAQTQSQEPSTPRETRSAPTRQETAQVPEPPRRERPTRSTVQTQTGFVLAANIDGARLTLDGNVLGAGNLTYTAISPGRHQYTVSKDGYAAVSGTVNVEVGQSNRLEVALSPLQQRDAGRSAQQTAFDQGTTALKAGEYEKAISLLTSAIETEPSQAAAYISRADAYTATRNRTSAHDDYLKGAEIYWAKGDPGQALSAYNKAIQADPKSEAAYLGRANLYLARGEEIAAISDYQSVMALNRHNVQAYYGTGEARYNLGNYKEAIKNFKDARSLDPNNPMVYQYLMLSYMGDDDVKNVKKCYDKFKELASKEQMEHLQSDNKFSAVLRLVAADQ